MSRAPDDLTTGATLLAAGDLRGARAPLARAAAGDDPAAHHDLALLLRASGDLAGAVRHAERAAELRPGAPTLVLLAGLRLLEGRRDEALALARRATALDPGHAPSRYLLGLLAGEASALRAALPDLPPLWAARARTQLHELEAGRRLPDDLCSAPLLTEVLGAAGARPRVAAPPARTPQPRQIDVAELAALLAAARRPVALTGAGSSSASGLATRKELWETHDRDQAVSIWRFREEPGVLWGVVRAFLGDGRVEPNAAHLALARLPLAGVVTQNVDGLHQAARRRQDVGDVLSSEPDAADARPSDEPRGVIELHGSLLDPTRCDACGAQGPPPTPLLGGPLPPRCACGAPLRPDVVLFGERVAVDRLARALELVSTCDLLLVVGTAADVSPAADLPRLAADRGVPVVELKRRPSRLHAALGTLHLPGPAEETLPAVVELLA